MTCAPADLAVVSGVLNILLGALVWVLHWQAKTERETRLKLQNLLFEYNEQITRLQRER